MASLYYAALEGILAFAPSGFLPLKNVKVTQTGSALKPGTVLYTKVDGNYAAYTDGAGTASAILISELPAATGNIQAVVLDGKAPVVRGQLIGLTTTAESALSARGIKVIGRTDTPYLPDAPSQPTTPGSLKPGILGIGAGYLSITAGYLAISG